MRIPPSVFVMSLVTAVPFGLAVRDTIHPQKTRAQIEEEKQAQYEIDLEKQAQADREAEEQRKTTVLKGLLGDKGKLGTYLDGIAVGAPVGQAEAIHDRTMNASDIIDFSYTPSADGKVASIRIVGGAGCDLRDVISKAWGSDEQWVDASTHTRAHFQSEDCELTLDRYVDIEQLIDKTLTASIPAGALGKTLDEVPGLDGDDVLVSPGLASTGGDVNVRFTTNDSGKIVGLSASFSADVDADATIRGRLDKLFGKGKQDADTGEWDWKGKTPVHYAYSSARVYLDIGQP